MSNAFPIVSALMPVLSERKNTGTTGRSDASAVRALVMGWYLCSRGG